MAIRMKEWGMLSYPRQGVHLPLNALNDWGRSGRTLGQGVAAAGAGAVELAKAIHRVQQAGNIADVASRLEQIGKETTEELLELPVRDWNYSWKQAYTPRVEELLNQFSGEDRERARQMSEAYGLKHSLEGLRRMQLKQIDTSREHWKQKVDAAVQQGDSQGACEWLEQGRGVFLPEEELPGQLDQAQNRSLHVRWQQRLQQAPYEALAAWQDEQEPRPSAPDTSRALEHEVDQTRRRVFSALAANLASGVELGQEPAEAELQEAVRAGVLPAEQLAGWQEARHPLVAAKRCDWWRRIDERSGLDDERLAVEIALAPVPLEQRRALMQRLRDTSGLPQQQRAGVSRSLWNMYLQGCFGCPGDEESLQALARLQEESLERQHQGKESDCSRWLTQLRAATENWVCYQAR